MTAPASGNACAAGQAPAQNPSRLTNAFHSALDVALLPARLAGRVWEAGRGSLASVACLTPGKIAGAAWNAAAEGAELFLMKLRALLYRTRGGVLLLGAPEGSTEPAAPEPDASGKEDATEQGLGGDCSLEESAPMLEESAPIEVESEELTAEALQAELAAECEGEVEPLPAKDDQAGQDVEAGIGAAAPSELATPAPAPAIAPSSEERAEMTEALPAEEPLPAAGDEADEPLSQVACEGVPLEDSVVLGAPAAADSAAVEPAPAEAPSGVLEAPLPAADPDAAEDAETAEVPASEDEVVPAAAPAPAEVAPAAAAELPAAEEAVAADDHPTLASEEAQQAAAEQTAEGEAPATPEASVNEEPDLVFVVSEDGEAKLVEGAEEAADAEDAPLSCQPAAQAVAAEEQLAAVPAPSTPAKLAAAEHPVATPKPAASSASSEADFVPAPRTPAASIVGGMRVAAASPKKKKRNPVHKVQKMLGLKSSSASGSKSRR